MIEAVVLWVLRRVGSSCHLFALCCLLSWCFIHINSIMPQSWCLNQFCCSVMIKTHDVIFILDTALFCYASRMPLICCYWLISFRWWLKDITSIYKTTRHLLQSVFPSLAHSPQSLSNGSLPRYHSQAQAPYLRPIQNVYQQNYLDTDLKNY